jgi:hypothetical protein
MPNDGGQTAGVVSISPDNGQTTQETTTTTTQSSDSGGQDLTSILSALDQENRSFAEGKNWKDLNAVFKSHRELEKAFSSRGNNQQQTTQTTDQTTTAVVKPTSPAGYEFKLASDFPKDGFYDKNLSETAKNWFHKAGLDTTQAQTLHDAFFGHMAETVKAQQTAQQTQFTERSQKAFEQLAKDFGGSPETPAFKRNLEMSRRAINHLNPDLKAALKEHGVIVDHNGQEVVTNAAIVSAFAKVGSRLFAEDELFGAPNVNENPFDPKKPNAKRAGELIKNDPELARTLIKAAGAEAERDWGWWLAKAPAKPAAR